MSAYARMDIVAPIRPGPAVLYEDPDLVAKRFLSLSHGMRLRSDFCDAPRRLLMPALRLAA